MNPALLNNQFVQVALPIVLTIFIAAWMNGRAIDGINKRIDDVNKRLDDVVARLGRIEMVLKTHGEKIAALDERTSPLGRRG